MNISNSTSMNGFWSLFMDVVLTFVIVNRRVKVNFRITNLELNY
jgi:hypothetical protein